MEDLYPHHFDALRTTDLTPSKIPTLEEQIKNNKTDEIKKNMENKDKKQTIDTSISASDIQKYGWIQSTQQNRWN